MKLKWIMAMVIMAFSVVVMYFLINGYLLHHAPVSTAKPSPAAIQAKIKAAKSGLFAPPSPSIIH